MTRLMSIRARRTREGIRKLRIQGAHRIAKHGLSAFFCELSLYCRKKRSLKDIVSHAVAVANVFKGIRPTEPMLFNYLDDILYDLDNISFIIRNKNASPAIKEYIKLKRTTLMERLNTDRKTLARYGYKLIKNRDIILTHCHSTSVMLTLALAKRLGRKFKVYATETRPLYQGRRTVKVLLSYGIDTTLIVDSAVGSIMDNITKVFVGGDLVTWNGDLANKIGTKTIAELARNRRIPFYTCAELYKLSPSDKVVIEQRNPYEILKRIPKRLTVLNPAFDITEARHISGIVTEKGVLSTKAYVETARKTIKMFERKMIP